MRPRPIRLEKIADPAVPPWGAQRASDEEIDEASTGHAPPSAADLSRAAAEFLKRESVAFVARAFREDLEPPPGVRLVQSGDVPEGEVWLVVRGRVVGKIAGGQAGGE